MPTLNAPSGLVADVRKIKGQELVKLAEAADDATAMGGFSAVLSGCWQSTLEAGPYAFLQPGEAKPDWTKMLKGDLLYTFVYLRTISMPNGDDYDFDVRCEECRKKYGWTVKLSELPVRALSDASRAKVRAGEPFEAVLSGGRRITFGLQTVAQENTIARLLQQQKRDTLTPVDTMTGQILTIDGVDGDLRTRWRFVADLDMDDLYSLREQMEAVDCGIDTAIETRCTNRECRWEQEIALPLGKTFFAPPRRAKKASPGELSARSSAASTANGSGVSSTISSGSSTGAAATPSPDRTC